jgi:SAM-dependent methyltransferase
MSPVSHSDIERYYTDRLARFGATPLGVDWSCAATQMLRFVKLLEICDFSTAFSLNDIGCGYGALAAFLDDRFPGARVDYLGVDLSPAMVRRARRRHRAGDQRRFAVGRVSPRIADYSVASGIMNVMLGHARVQWECHVADILADMRRTSRLGFAVNFVAAGSSRTADQLYRTRPDKWVRHCEGELDCAVQTIVGYGLQEFTLLARCR